MHKIVVAFIMTVSLSMATLATLTGQVKPRSYDSNFLNKEVDLSILEKIAGEAKKYYTSDLIISEDGRVILELRTDPGRRPVETMSITKSFVSLAIGFLIDDGYLKSIDIPVYHIYPEWHQGKKQNITLRHLLNHTSGLQTEQTIYEITRAPDVVQLALAAELSEEPGSEFKYNNKATNLLPDMVQKLSGKSIDVYLTEKLFAPLEISDFSWNRDPKGHLFGMSGLHLHHTDLLKVGQMLLDNGKWKGKQIVNPKWIEESLKSGESNNTSCGLLWWLRHNAEGRLVGFAAQGYLGQYLVVIPESRIVAVRFFDEKDHPGGDDPQRFDFRNFGDLLLQLRK